MNPDAHIQNNYHWREYRPPASGNCDPSSLVWIDIWFRAQQILSRMAVRPVRGVAAVSARLWAWNIQRLKLLLAEASNTRFFMGQGGTLASTAQGRGSYEYNRRGDAAATYEAMQFAPKASGGFEELFTGAQAAWLRKRTELTCLDGAHCNFTPMGGVGATSTLSIETSVAWAATTALGQAFAAWGSTGQTTFDLHVYSRDRSRLVPARLDLDAFMENWVNEARVFSAPQLSLGEVTMRSTSFYLNAYLDYAAMKGVVATEVVNNARMAWAGIQGSANDALNATVGTASGIVTAIVSAINGAAGAVIGVVLAIVALLIALGGAAVGTGPFVPLPFYLRMYSGSCEARGWAPGPTAARPTTPLPSSAVATYPPDPPPAASGGGKVFGWGAVAAGLWLLLGKR